MLEGSFKFSELDSAKFPRRTRHFTEYISHAAKNPPVTRTRCSTRGGRPGCGRAGPGPGRWRGRGSAPPPPPSDRSLSSGSAAPWSVDLLHMSDCRHPSLQSPNCGGNAKRDIVRRGGITTVICLNHYNTCHLSAVKTKVTYKQFYNSPAYGGIWGYNSCVRTVPNVDYSCWGSNHWPFDW